eukprot:jgi/Phyca11/19969/fgenesh1_pg.PHYCAscaffold_54_\
MFSQYFSVVSRPCVSFYGVHSAKVKRLTDESNSFKITSIYLQEYEGLSAPDNDPVEALLIGEAKVTFINSKATDTMEDLLRKKREENEKHLNRVVAIVDPPRAGLHHLGIPRSLSKLSDSA